jgi:hypothetical protein
MVCSTRCLRCFATAGVLALVLGLSVSQASRAQAWTRTARVVAPIESGPLQTFLDRLVRAEERAAVPVRRSPDDTTTMPLSVLRDTLRRAYGLDVTSATRVTAGYRFSIDGMSGFEWKLTELQFFYGGDATASEVSFLVIDPQDEWAQTMLREEGLSLPSNPDEFRPFRDYFGFLFLTQLEDADIIEIGGQPMPEGFDVRKRVLIQQVNRFAFSDTY